MLEPVKRTNFESYKVRENNKLRMLSLNKDSKKDGNISPTTALDGFNFPQSPIPQNENNNFALKRFLNKSHTPKQSIQTQDQNRNHSSSQQNKNNPNSTIQNNKKAVELMTPNQSTLFNSTHRKSLSTLSITIGSAKSQKPSKVSDYFMVQNSPIVQSSLNSATKKLYQSDQQFFNSKNTSNLYGSMISPSGNDTPAFAFGNQGIGLPSDFQSKYMNMPKTAGHGHGRRDSMNTSKVTQVYMEQYLDNTQLLDKAESKIYKFFDMKTKNDLLLLQNSSSSYFNSAFQTSRGEGAINKKIQIDCFNPFTLSSGKNETFFFSSHNFYYFVIPIKSKLSPLRLSKH